MRFVPHFLFLHFSLTDFQEELAEARGQIEQLEATNTSLNKQNQSRTIEFAQEGDERSKELSVLRNRMTLSQQNWNEERDDLIQREAFAREEFENAKQAMQDWEVLATEERSIRENLQERVSELEEQIASNREVYQRIKEERNTQSLTVDGLQKALQEIQDGKNVAASVFRWLNSM